MKRLLIASAALALATFGAGAAQAQSTAAPVLPGFLSSTGCAPGQTICYIPYSNTNPMPVAATTTVSAFTPSASGARGTPVAVTTADTSGTLPTGAAVVVSNVGTTNGMYCNVNGVVSTASDQFIPPSSWFEFQIPTGQTTLHCISPGGGTTANMVGGAGIAAGSGGGGGSSVNGATVNAYPAAVTPSALTSSTLTTGGTAQNVITIASGVIAGAYICNPATAGGEGVPTAENILVNPIATATTTEGNGNSAIVPGQCYNVPPGTNHSVSWIAATTGHIISGVQFK